MIDEIRRGISNVPPSFICSIVATDDEQFKKLINVVEEKGKTVNKYGINPKKAGYVLLYYRKWSHVLREYVRNPSREVVNWIIEVFKQIDNGISLQEAIRKANFKPDHEYFAFLRSFGPIFLTASNKGYRKYIPDSGYLLFPSQKELKKYDISDQDIIWSGIIYILIASKIDVDSVILPDSTVYKISNPQVFFSSLYTDYITELKVKIVEWVMKALINRAIENIIEKKDDPELSNFIVSYELETIIGETGFYQITTNGKKPSILFNAKLLSGGNVLELEIHGEQSISTIEAIIESDRPVVFDIGIIEKVIRKLFKLVMYSRKREEEQLRGVIRDIKFKYETINENGFRIYLPTKFKFEYEFLARVSPPILSKSFKKRNIEVDEIFEDPDDERYTVVHGIMTGNIEELPLAIRKIEEMRNIASKIAEKYKNKPVTKRKPSQLSVEEAVADYITLLLSIPNSKIYNSIVAITRSFMTIEPNTREIINKAYKKHRANPLIIQPEKIIASLISDRVLVIKDKIYVKDKPVEDLLKSRTPDPIQAVEKLIDYLSTDMLLQADDPEVYLTLSKYLTIERLRKIEDKLTSKKALDILKHVNVDELVRKHLIRKIIREGTSEEKIYVVKNWIPEISKHLRVEPVDGKYILALPYYYIDITDISDDHIKLIAYRKDTKIGFPFEGKTFTEVLRKIGENYDKYLEKLPPSKRKSDKLEVIENIPKEDESELVSA